MLELLEDRTALSTLLVNPSGLTASGSVAYRTIQAAVNAAAAGDTIVVDPGTYTESVSIPANAGGLTLQGSKSGVNPVPGRSGPESVLNGTILINAPGVTVDGFTVISSSQWTIFTAGTNSVLKNNKVTNQRIYGIQVGVPDPQSTAVSSVILDNVVSVSPAGSDIYLFRSPNNTVRGNAVSGGLTGIDVYFSDNTTVQWNDVKDCSLAAIRLRGTHGSLVEYNTGSGNGQPNLDESEGSSGNTIRNNFGSVPPPGSRSIVNGDFEAGNTGFTSGYTYSPGELGPARSYDVITNPALARPRDLAPVSYRDHTTGTGLMLAVNGAAQPNVVVWSQTVPVVPNTTYDFSLWISSWFGPPVVTLDVRFNGASLLSLAAPSQTAVWVNHTGRWNSGSSASVTVEIRSTNGLDIGGDFALDDISLTATPLTTTTATAVSSSAAPSSYGQPVTFTATVTSGGSLVTTGTVTFNEGNTLLSSAVPLDSSGRASLQIATLTAAGSPHTITAQYNGTASLATSSGSVSQSVNRAPLLVTANNASRVYGQANPGLSGTITGIQNGDPITVIYATAATPLSNVASYATVPTLSDGGTGKLSNYTLTSNNGTLTITAAPLTVTPAHVSRPFGSPNPALGGTISGLQNGDNITASFSTTATLTSPVGIYPITGTLNDPNNRQGNYSVTLNQGIFTVTPTATTTTVVNSSANPAVFGQAVTFTAIVSGVTSGVGNPTGVVAFLEGGTTLGSAILSNGQASFTTSSLPVGNRPITAVYSGGTNFNASSSPVLTQTTSKGATIVTLTASSPSVSLGQPVTFTIVVSPVAPATGSVTGTVTLRNNTIPLATVSLSNGRASFTTATLPVGRLSITAEASGDDQFQGSTSAPVDQIVGSLNQRFVAQLYLDLLGRTADEVGLAGFTQFLDRGGSRLTVAQGILASAEYRTVVVQNLYQEFLKRVADPAGLGAAVTFLSSGGTIAQLKAVLLGSIEYFQTRGQGTNLGFLTAVFQDVLGRNLDASGATTFSQLLSRNVSRTEVAALIVSSTEANQVLVSGFYERFLRRPVDPTGLTAFVSPLQQGTREEEIIASLTSSDEYLNRLR